MKVVLTGKNSYIAQHTRDFMIAKGMDAECVSVRNGTDNIDFSGVDAVVHCAAIVHRKERKFKDQYDDINYNLTKSIAVKAKSCGVKTFVFMSTMAVYGVREGVIDKNTQLKPSTLYGKSKLKAENFLFSIANDDFNIIVIRPPMVYGKNCPGNYGKLCKIAGVLPVIPDTENKKSLIYIDNLSYVIYSLLKDNKKGIYMPMDSKYVSTGEIMYLVSGKAKSVFLGSVVKIMPLNIAKKAFGTLYYAEDIALKVDYVSFEEGVRLSIQ